MLKVVTIKLTATELKALDQLVDMGFYRSRSEAIREALGGLFLSRHIKPEATTDMRMERMKHPARRKKCHPAYHRGPNQ